MLKISLSAAMADAAAKQADKSAKLANKLKLACDPAGREWRKRDRRLRQPFNLSAPKRA